MSDEQMNCWGGEKRNKRQKLKVNIVLVDLFLCQREKAK